MATTYDVGYLIGSLAKGSIIRAAEPAQRAQFLQLAADECA
jgi:hypothetical protein